MGKDSFPELCSVLGMITGSKNEQVTVAVEGLSYDLGGDALREQARQVCRILDSYREPVLPFKDVTQEEINREDRRLMDRYGFVIWTNSQAGTDVDCARRVKDDPEYFLGMPEDEVRRMSIEANEEDRDILLTEFGSVSTNSILVIGTVGHWTGRKSVHTAMGALGEVFRLLTGDECTLYVRDGDLQAENVHHDGTDYFTIRMFKDGADPEMFVPGHTVVEETESLVPVLASHFGWSVPQATEDGDSGHGHYAQESATGKEKE